MSNSEHYSEEDFQMILDNEYTRDFETFEKHLKACDSCTKSFRAYSSVLSFLNYKLEVPKPETNFAENVLNSLLPESNSNKLIDRLINSVIIFIVSVIVIICINFLRDSHLSNSSILVLTLFIASYFLISFREIILLTKKFRL